MLFEMIFMRSIVRKKFKNVLEESLIVLGKTNSGGIVIIKVKNGIKKKEKKIM